MGSLVPFMLSSQPMRLADDTMVATTRGIERLIPWWLGGSRGEVGKGLELFYMNFDF